MLKDITVFVVAVRSVRSRSLCWHSSGGRHIALRFSRNDNLVQKGLIEAAASHCCHILPSTHTWRRSRILTAGCGSEILSCVCEIVHGSAPYSCSWCVTQAAVATLAKRRQIAVCLSSSPETRTAYFVDPKNRLPHFQKKTVTCPYPEPD